jgi:hypothetical protein
MRRRRWLVCFISCNYISSCYNIFYSAPTRSMQEILAEAALENGMEVDMDFGGGAGNNDPGEDSDSDDGWADVPEECDGPHRAMGKVRRALIQM